MKNRLLFTSYLILATLLLTELGLRVLQYREYRHSAFQISSEPSFCLLPDSTYGFRLAPGVFRVTINSGLTFSVEHDTTGFRVTGRGQENKPLIVLLGCSYTYGYGIDDSLTMAWKLQKALPGFNVRCLAVPGFGTVQGYMQLRALLEGEEKPAAVVLNHCDFHEDRNALTPVYRKSLSLGLVAANTQVINTFSSFRYPYLQAREDTFLLSSCSWEDLYHDWPLRDLSALVNLLQTTWEKWDPAEREKSRLTREIIFRMDRLCKARGVRFAVAALTQNEATLDLLSWNYTQGIASLDMSLPLQDSTYYNYPFDTHPNAKAHRHFARQLAGFVRSWGGQEGRISATDAPGK